MPFDPEDLDQPTVTAQAFKPRRPVQPTPKARAPKKATKNHDGDDDGLPDEFEKRIGSKPNDPDSDDDGLPDATELQLGTHLRKWDTDGDGIADSVEVAIGETSPRIAEPQAQLADLGRYGPPDLPKSPGDTAKLLGVDTDTDSDGDGFPDWIEHVRGTNRFDPSDLTPDGIDNNLQPLDRFVQAALDQVGTPFKSGAEGWEGYRHGTPPIGKGGLVEWAAQQAGVKTMPKGSSAQETALIDDPGRSMSVASALRTKGALVFGHVDDPATGGQQVHVAISLGNGKVLDVNEATGRFEVMDPSPIYTRGALIPELHTPKGDINGDGDFDHDELLMRGEISRRPLPKHAFNDVVDPSDDEAIGALPPGEGDADPVTGLPNGTEPSPVMAASAAGAEPDTAGYPAPGPSDPLPSQALEPTGGDQYAQTRPAPDDTYGDPYDQPIDDAYDDSWPASGDPAGDASFA